MWRVNLRIHTTFRSLAYTQSPCATPRPSVNSRFSSNAKSSPTSISMCYRCKDGSVRSGGMKQAFRGSCRPNMPTLDTAIVYPGMCLFEGTNVSEGRGTTRPFELFGAPWIDRQALVEAMNRESLPGVTFRAVSFEPTFQKHAQEICHGAQIHVTDRNSFLPVQTAMRLLGYLTEQHRDEFRWNPPPYEYEEEKLPIEILLGRPIEDSPFRRTA